MRLVTRSDFDGLACGVLLKEVNLIDDFLFVHPKDLQDGKIAVTANDILTNVPYVPGCGMWFDHHSSENERLGDGVKYEGLSKLEPSCARVIWEYFGGYEKFSPELDSLLLAVDKVDSANLTPEEIIDPKGWIMLGFIMDPRTGLGRYRDYNISNYQLMLELIDLCRIKSAEEILNLPDVKERVERYRDHHKLFKQMILDKAVQHGNLVVLDLRAQKEIYTGNRFLVYSLFPQCNVSVRVIWGLNKQNIVFTVGHSIVNRTCKVDIGSLMLKHGGGGHQKVGTCQVNVDDSDEVLDDLIAALR